MANVHAHNGTYTHMYMYTLLVPLQDVFYLTVEEIFAFVEGRSVTNNLSGLVELRKAEYNSYKKVSI